LVQAGAAGRYAFRTLEFDAGFSRMPDTVLATMVSDGPAQALQPLPDRLLPFVDLRPLPVDNRRVITFQVLPLDRFAPVIPMATFLVDNKEFDMDRVDQVMRLGSTEEWVVRNASNVWHPFHIHINDFQVTQVNGRPVPVRGFKDTFPVAPFGEFTMRSRFLDFDGKFVFHCHILQHEDGGMMQVVEVR
jgi:FtsP/CotA-like multicopper oxidase with cupredoxin domain